jgi:hypothetical protein
MEAAGNPEGVVAADGHQAVEVQLLECRPDQLGAVVALVGIGAGTAEDGSTPRKDPPDVLEVERDVGALEDAAPAVAEADDLISVGIDALADDAADDSVKSRTVTAAGEDSDAHGVHLMVRARLSSVTLTLG